LASDINVASKVISYALGNPVFKSLYINLSLAFQVTNFLFRDAGTTGQLFDPVYLRKQIGGYKSDFLKNAYDVIADNTYRQLFGKFIKAKYYIKAARGIKEKNFNHKYSIFVEEAMANHLIEVNAQGRFNFDPSLSASEQAGAARILSLAGLSPAKYIEGISNKKGINNVIDKTFKFVENIGETFEEIPKVAAYMYFKEVGLMAQNPGLYSYIIRNFAGSPNFWNKGTANSIVSNVLLFFQPIKEGLRNTWMKATKKDYYGKGSRGTWWLRMARRSIIPTMATVAAEEGMFGEDIKRQMEKISEYLKNNYHIIPVGINKRGQTKYYAIPMAEEDRQVKAMTRMVLKTLLDPSNPRIYYRTLIDLATYTGGQLPATTPGYNILSAWTLALGKGGNPYDNFRRQNIFFDTEMKSSDKAKAKILLK